MAGTCECGNEPSGCIKCGEFLDQLKTCYLKKDSAPWSKQVYFKPERVFDVHVSFGDPAVAFCGLFILGLSKISAFFRDQCNKL